MPIGACRNRTAVAILAASATVAGTFAASTTPSQARPSTLTAGVSVPGSSAHPPAAALRVCNQLTNPVVQFTDSTGRSLLTLTGRHDATHTRPLGSTIYAAPHSGAGLVGVHRLHLDRTGDDVWTPTGTTYRRLLAAHYRDRGVVFWTPRVAQDGCTTGVRQLGRGIAHTVSTTTSRTRDLVAHGWKDQGVAFQASTRPVEVTGPLYTDWVPAMGTYNTSRGADRDAAYAIGATPTATWVSGPQDDQRLARVVAKAAAQRQTPQVVLYGIPGRDCGSFSAGGVADAGAYRAWIAQVSRIIGNHRALVVVEPDAINYCGSRQVRGERAPLLRQVGATFHGHNPHASLYLHVGSGSLTQAAALDKVRPVDLRNYRGFAMGVASLAGTGVEQVWAERFVATLAAAGVPGAHYVVDTSRNGISWPENLPGAAYRSCNNPNAALGQRPTVYTDAEHADAYLWVKHPGVSDGECGLGSAKAGTWDGVYAQAIYRNAVRVGTVHPLG